MNDSPGSVNAHTHLYSGLVPLGMPAPSPPPATFRAILQRVWWRLDRALDADSLRASARYYVADALLAGTTTLIDHHESPSCIEGSLDVLADACQELGIRAVLCYGATGRNGGEEEARRGLRECERFVRENRRPKVRGLLGLHASFTVGDDSVREAGRVCRTLKVPLHVHLAEDVVDVDDARERGYDGPLERLIALDALPPGSILAHGVHLTAAQVRRAARRGCWFVQNPRSNKGNRVGYPGALAVTDRVALGTDGYPSDMREETRALEEEVRAHGEDLIVSRARVDAGRQLVTELFKETPRDAVTLKHGRVVDSVIAGRPVVRNGQLVHADLDEIEDEARTQAKRLWQRMERL